MHARVRRWFRVIAVVEALTWVGLLVGMAFKYVLADDEVGVQVMGPLHGAAFLAFVAVTLLAARTFGWTARLTLVGLASSVPPLGSLAFERWTVRHEWPEVSGRSRAPGGGRRARRPRAGAAPPP
ncbi:MAG: DUF3817 domain-containing protein [Actinomycetota bacterium]|nr:DUF3817 domain-containing protein [Actinomycetota bacterium]